MSQAAQPSPSAPASELKKVSISSNNLAIAGLISGFVGVYASGIHPSIAAALTIPVFVWGADTIRRIASYGLGTGVPSIGNLATSMGILAAFVGFRFQPVFGVAFAAIAGLIYGIVISKFKILGIPRFRRYITELAVSACLALLLLISVITGGFNWFTYMWSTQGDYFWGVLMTSKGVMATGFIIIAYWLTSFTMFHPFNVSLGGGERQARTLRVAIVAAGATIVLVGSGRLGYLAIASAGNYGDALVTILIGAIVWIYGLFSYFKVCTREAASTVWTGIPPKTKR